MADRVRKYAIWITDSEGADHLYTLTQPVDLTQLYWIWLEAYEGCEGEVWIDEVLESNESPSFNYGVYVEYTYPQVNFGNASVPIEIRTECKFVGSYGQLERAFETMYLSEYSEWNFTVKELSIVGKQYDYVIIDEILP